MTEENKAVETTEVEELGFLEEITLVNDKGVKNTYRTPEHISGRLYKEAKRLTYLEKKLQFKNNGKGQFDKDENGDLIPFEATEEIAAQIEELYENFIVKYFKDQFTLEELREGLDARIYEETLVYAHLSALGNRIVPKKK